MSNENRCIAYRVKASRQESELIFAEAEKRGCEPGDVIREAALDELRKLNK